MTERNDCKVTGGSVEIEWCAQERIAIVRYGPNTNLTAPDGTFLVGSLQGWIGDDGEPFSVLAFARGVRGTDAAYRAIASGFFRKHRDVAGIALLNMGPVMTVVTEMFRIGTGIPLKAFSEEAAARDWLATTRARR